MTLLHRVSPKKLDDRRRVPGVGPRVPADARRAAEPRRTARHRRSGRRPVAAMPFDDARRLRRAAAVSRRSRRRRRSIGAIIAAAHAAKVLVAVATDLLALTLLTPPGELGADVVRRQLAALRRAARLRRPARGVLRDAPGATCGTRPGRIIGVSVDAHGHRAYRMALQTREQHIRREKATSNICTAQALLANMAAMYAVYHGARRPDGHRPARARPGAGARGRRRRRSACTQENAHYFDTLRFTLTAAQAAAVRAQAVEAGFNLRYVGDTGIGVVARRDDHGRPTSQALVGVFAAAVGKPAARRVAPAAAGDALPPALRRTSRVPDAPGVPPASLRERDDALHEEPRAEGHRPRRLDDPARLVHDEAERRQRDVPGDLAGVLADASVRAGRPDRRATRRSAASSRRRWPRSPGSPPCRCSRTPARRASWPACW